MGKIKYTIIKIACILTIIALVIFVGNIVVIANQILVLTNIYCVYGFYALILALLIIFVVMPIRRVLKMPNISKLSIKETDKDGKIVKLPKEKLYSIGKHLVKYYPAFRKQYNNENKESYLEAKEQYEKVKKDFKKNVERCNVSLYDEQKQNISNEIDARLNNIDAIIKKYGKRVFVLTAISQNSKFDTVSVWVLNIRMIKELIDASGFRPSYYQLFQIYWRVIITGALAYATSEVSEAVDSTILTEVWSEVGIKMGSDLFGSIMKVFTKSLADGAVNGLLTLRLGFVTKKYLEEGFDKFKSNNNNDRIEIYKSAFKQAWKCKKDIFTRQTDINKMAS